MYLALLGALFATRLSIGKGAAAGRQIYWGLLIGLFLFSAFRFRVGCDWSNYYLNFVISEGLSFDEALQRSEPVWWLIQIAFNKWGLPYPAVNVLTSAIFFIGVHALARRQPDRLGFLVMLFPILIINMPMSGIRQAAAIGFLCLGFVAFVDRKPVQFVMWLLAGSTFHASALFFLLLAPVATGKYTRQRLVFSVLLALPGAYFMAQTDSAQLAVDRYVDTGVDAFGAVFRVGILALTGAFFFIYLQRRWATQFIADYGLASVAAWMMLALFPIVGVSTVIADRFGYYLIPVQAMMFARIPYIKGLANRPFFAIAPFLGLALVFLVWTSLSSLFDACYVPYQSWLFGHSDFGQSGL